MEPIGEASPRLKARIGVAQNHNCLHTEIESGES